MEMFLFNTLSPDYCFVLSYYRNCKKFGRQSSIIVAIIVTEFLITVKFDWETISKPLPRHIAVFWTLGCLGLVLYTIWKFYYFKDVKSDLPKEKLEVLAKTNGHTSPESYRSKGEGQLRSRSNKGSSSNSKEE